MSLQATEATVVTLGEDNLIIRWVMVIKCLWGWYLSTCVSCVRCPCCIDIAVDLVSVGRDTVRSPLSIQLQKQSIEL